MPNEELYKKLYAKYAPHLSPDEINKKLEYASTINPSEFINSFYKKNTVVNDDVKHVSVLDLEEEVGDSWWTKEGNAAGFLTRHYRQQGVDVEFIEAKVGYNQLKMVVDGVELDGGIDLKGGFLSTGTTDWGDLQKDIQLKIEDAFGDKKATRKRALKTKTKTKSKSS